MTECKEVIEKAVAEHEKGSWLPNSFVNQYYSILIQRGIEEPTFEVLLKNCSEKKERKQIKKQLYIRTMNFITEMLGDDEWDEEDDDYEEFRKYQFDHPFDRYNGMLGEK